jgi:hypothetical protein
MDLLGYSAISQHFLKTEQKLVVAAVSSLSLLVPRIRFTLRAGVDQLFNQLMRPKLRTLVSDIYKDVSYVLDDDGYASAEYRDIVRKRFVKTWDSLVDGYKAAVLHILPLDGYSLGIYRILSLKATTDYSLDWLLMSYFVHGRSSLWGSNILKHVSFLGALAYLLNPLNSLVQSDSTTICEP